METRSGEIIAAYGELLEGDADEAGCVDQRSDLVVEVLKRSDVKARRSKAGAFTQARSIAVPLPSMNLALEIAGVREPITSAAVRTGRRPPAWPPPAPRVCWSRRRRA